MSFLIQPARSRTLPITHSLRLSSIPVRSYAKATSDWEGRQPYEHVTNREDHTNIQTSASKSGKSDRTAGSECHSQATKGKHNEKAKEDHPEAPKPVIGMNDERGTVSDL